MIGRTKIRIVALFLFFLFACIIAHAIASGRFGAGSIETYALAGIVAVAGAVALSLTLDLSFKFPLAEYAADIKKKWKDDKSLPESGTAPSEFVPLVLAFQEIWGDVQKKMSVLDEMKDLESAKYEFISIANHQLRTPLTEVIWAVQALKESPQVTSSPEASAILSKITNGIDRISEITKQFLAAAELSSDLLVEDNATSDTESVLVATIQMLKSVTEERSMPVQVEKDAGFITTVKGNPRLLGFIFETLITNAVAYGISGTPIRVRLSNGTGTVDVRVSNEGETLSAEEVPRLFDRFFRGEQARKIRPDGSGLALYLCRRIIERYGGSIRAEVDGRTVSFFASLPWDARVDMGKFVDGY